MMTHDPVNMEPQARKIVKWITAQRNGQGGFYSTQVRCMCLCVGQSVCKQIYHSHGYSRTRYCEDKGMCVFVNRNICYDTGMCG